MKPLKCLMGRRREVSVWVDDMLRMQEYALQGLPTPLTTIDLCHAWLHQIEQRCLAHMRDPGTYDPYYNEETLQWIRAERARFLLIIPR